MEIFSLYFRMVASWENEFNFKYSRRLGICQPTPTAIKYILL